MKGYFLKNICNSSKDEIIVVISFVNRTGIVDLIEIG
jgi:hypothetical protein